MGGARVAAQPHPLKSLIRFLDFCAYCEKWVELIELTFKSFRLIFPLSCLDPRTFVKACSLIAG